MQRQQFSSETESNMATTRNKDLFYYLKYGS